MPGRSFDRSFVWRKHDEARDARTAGDSGALLQDLTPQLDQATRTRVGEIRRGTEKSRATSATSISQCACGSRYFAW